MEDRPSRETGDIVANVIADTARLGKMGKRCASSTSVRQIWLVSMRDFERLVRIPWHTHAHDFPLVTDRHPVGI